MASCQPACLRARIAASIAASEQRPPSAEGLAKLAHRRDSAAAVVEAEAELERLVSRRVRHFEGRGR